MNYVVKGANIRAYTSANTYDNVKTRLTNISFAAHLDIYPIESVVPLYGLLGLRADVNLHRDENGLEGLYNDVSGWYTGPIAGLGVLFNRNRDKGGYFWGIEFRWSEDWFRDFTLNSYTYKGWTSTYDFDNRLHNRSFELLFSIGNNPNPKPKK